MSRRILALTSVLAASACASQADIDALPPQAVVPLAMNYQQAYANLNKGARTCMAGTAPYIVDGQLYSELGYGEVSVGAQTISYTPVMEARVSKSGSGSSSISVKGTGLASRSIPLWAVYWAKGGRRCPVATLAEAPPA